MPRYYFKVRDARASFLPHGVSLPDLNAARREAVRYAGAVLQSDSAWMDLHEDWFLEVTNDDGLILFRFDFMMTAAPAAWTGAISKS